MLNQTRSPWPAQVMIVAAVLEVEKEFLNHVNMSSTNKDTVVDSLSLLLCTTALLSAVHAVAIGSEHVLDNARSVHVKWINLNHLCSLLGVWVKSRALFGSTIDSSTQTIAMLMVGGFGLFDLINPCLSTPVPLNFKKTEENNEPPKDNLNSLRPA
jgi:hypothetical protein